MDCSEPQRLRNDVITDTERLEMMERQRNDVIKDCEMMERASIMFTDAVRNR